jgi:hypothetical protein
MTRPAWPGAPRARRAGAVAGAVAMLVAAVAVQAAYPSYEQRYRPIASTGEANQRVRTRDFDVRVEKIDVARTVVSEDGDGEPVELRTGGFFVIVTATVTARRETIELAGAYLRAEDGSRTLVSDAVKVPAVDVVGAGTLNAGAAAPSIRTAIRPLQPRRLALIFEVPGGRLAGAELWLSVGRMEWRGDRQAEDWFRPQARVDLGITRGRAAALLAAAPRRYQVEKQCWAPPNC